MESFLWTHQIVQWLRGLWLFPRYIMCIHIASCCTRSICLMLHMNRKIQEKGPGLVTLDHYIVLQAVLQALRVGVSFFVPMWLQKWIILYHHIWFEVDDILLLLNVYDLLKHGKDELSIDRWGWVCHCRRDDGTQEMRLGFRKAVCVFCISWRGVGLYLWFESTSKIYQLMMCLLHQVLWCVCFHLRYQQHCPINTFNYARRVKMRLFFGTFLPLAILAAFVQALARRLVELEHVGGIGQ